MPSKLPRINLTVPLDIYADLTHMRGRLDLATLCIQLLDEIIALKKKQAEAFIPTQLKEEERRDAAHFANLVPDNKARKVLPRSLDQDNG